jgi:hypothetical protein
MKLHSAHLVAAALLAPSLAFASLGGTVDSVQADQVQIKAASRVATAKVNYTVHEMQAASGTVVREYVAANGTVFGVAWSGPVMPNLRQIFGQYFETFANAPRVKVSGHSHLFVQQKGLVVRSSGRMRAFKGNAYIPTMLPQGVTADQIL